MKNIPKYIYLQVDPKNEEDRSEEANFEDLLQKYEENITWHWHRINDSDIEYILNKWIYYDQIHTINSIICHR